MDIKEKEAVLYPEFKCEITPEQLIEIIPGPDFPTGATIYDQQEILNVYEQEEEESSKSKKHQLMRGKQENIKL